MTLKEHFICFYPFAATFWLGVVIIFYTDWFNWISESNKYLCMIPVVIIADIIYVLFQVWTGIYDKHLDNKEAKNNSIEQGSIQNEKRIIQNSEEEVL